MRSSTGEPLYAIRSLCILDLTPWSSGRSVSLEAARGRELPSQFPERDGIRSTGTRGNLLPRQMRKLGKEATVHASHSIVKTTLPGRLSDCDACVTELGAALTCPSSREAGWLVHHARKLQLILILECRRCLHQLQEETVNPANEMSRGEPPVGVNWPLADTQISSM